MQLHGKQIFLIQHVPWIQILSVVFKRIIFRILLRSKKLQPLTLVVVMDDDHFLKIIVQTETLQQVFTMVNVLQEKQQIQAMDLHQKYDLSSDPHSRMN